MKKFLVLLMIVALSLFGVSAAFAYDVKVDEDTYAKIGVKGQIWYQNLEGATAEGGTAADSTKNANDVSIRQIRLYAAGQITNLFKFGANVDFAKGVYDKKDTAAVNTTGSSGVTDGYVMLDFMKEAKLMVGIYRMAVSRVALQDSYTYMTVHAPAVAGARYLSNMNNYRDAGATLWGDVLDGKVRYNIGVWDGNYTALAVGATGSGVPAGGETLLTVNPTSRSAYTARVAVNLWDPEPGYTNSCCYLGKAKLLSIGLGYLNQGYASATAGSGQYTVKTADAILAMDPITVEAGYFMYDFDTLATTGQKPTGYYAQAGFKIGQIEPAVRYEKWDADNGLNDYKRYVAAVNYYIDGHNAKITLERLAQISDGNVAMITRDTPDNSRSFADWTLQLEFQF